MDQVLNRNLIVMANIFNLLLLITGCALGLLGAVEKNFNAAPVIILALLLTHIMLTKKPVSEASIIIVTGIIGSAVELVNSSVGLYQYNHSVNQMSILPTWIVFEWFVIGACIRHCFQWFSRQWYLASLAGIVIGSIFYYAAYQIGAIQYNESSGLNFFLASLCWAPAFPTIIYINKLLLLAEK